MSGLRASNFRRIYVALKLDWILTIVLPLVFLALVSVLDHQLRRAGLTSQDVAMEDVNRVSSFLTGLLYAYLAAAFCATGLCALLAVRGLGEAESCSLWLHSAKQWFIGCMLMNAVAMAVRIVHISLNNSGATVPLLALYPAVQVVTLALQGGGTRALMKGLGDMLESIGDHDASHRTRSLAPWVTAAYLAFVVAYIVFMTDLFPSDRSPGLAIAMLILFVLALGFWLVVRFKAVRRAGAVWRTLAAISDEVIT